MKYLIIILVVFGEVSFTIAQKHTLSLQEGIDSPKASLRDISWIAGHWRGEAFGGITEEIWSPPLGGSMMAVFKHVKDDKVTFYEIIVITEEEGSLILKLKHFHKNLKGWEEKDETVDFPLVKIESDKVYFDDFTFEKISDNEINVYVVIGKTGEEEEVKFEYKKYTY